MMRVEDVLSQNALAEASSSKGSSRRRRKSWATSSGKAGSAMSGQWFMYFIINISINEKSQLRDWNWLMVAFNFKVVYFIIIKVMSELSRRV